MARKVIFNITGGPNTTKPLEESLESSGKWNKVLVPFQTDRGLVKALVMSIEPGHRNENQLKMTCDCLSTRSGAVKEGAKVVYNLVTHTGTIKGFYLK